MSKHEEQKGYTPAELGAPDVWIRRMPSGSRIMAVKAKLSLSEKHNEITVIENKPMITADGYYRLNQVASLGIITPDNIKIPSEDGVRDVANPFPIIDKSSGTQRGVWVKKLAVGYSPIGSLVITSTTMFYDFSVYFIADLQKKIRYDKTAGRLCFFDQLTEEEKKAGIFMRIEGELGLWANTEHSDVIKCVSTWIQNKQFGERKAQTIAERNALRHHPALSVRLEGLRGGDKNHMAEVTVIGWQHSHSKEELEEIARSAERGESVEVDGQEVEYKEFTGEVTQEDQAAGTEADPEMVQSDEPDEEEQEGIF